MLHFRNYFYGVRCVSAEHQGLCYRSPLTERSYLATDLEWVAIDKAPPPPLNEALLLIQREWSREVGNIDPLVAISTVRRQKCQREMSTCHFGCGIDTKHLV